MSRLAATLLAGTVLAATGLTAAAPVRARPAAPSGHFRLALRIVHGPRAVGPGRGAPTGGVALTVALANGRAVPSRRDVLAFWLSRDRRAGRDDRPLGGRVAVSPLPAHRTTRRALRLALGVATPPGKYYVVACLTAGRRTCAVSSRAVPLAAIRPRPAVAVPPGGGGPVGAAGQVPAAAPPAAGVPPGPLDALVDAAVDAPDLPAGVAATRRLLTAAGIGVAADDGTPTPEPGGLSVDATQLQAIATDARHRPGAGRMTLDELATDLVQGGLPLGPDLGGRQFSQAGSALQTFLAGWLERARSRPEAPDSAPILILQRLAQRQAAPVDLAQPASYAAADLHLTFLDLAVLSSGIAQAAPALRGSGAAPLRSLRAAAAPAPPPCSALKQSLEDAVAFAGTGWGYAVGKTAAADVEYLATLLAEMLGSAAGTAAERAAQFSQVLSVFGLLMKVQAVAELYAITTTRLDAAPRGPLHQPDENAAPVLVDFHVVAGVGDEDWAAYQRTRSAPAEAIKDCLSFLGLPVPTGAGAIGAAVSGWKVGWRLLGGGSLGQISVKYNTFQFPGQLQNHLTPRDDHSGESHLLVDLREEKSVDHPGQLVTRPMVVQSIVTTDPPPNPALLLGVLDYGAYETVDPFGIAAPVVTLALGMFQSLVAFTDEATVQVSYHLPVAGQWRGVVHSDEMATLVVPGPVTSVPNTAATSSDVTRHARHDVMTVTGTASAAVGRGMATWVLSTEIASDGSSSLDAGYANQNFRDPRCVITSQGSQSFHASMGAHGPGLMTLDVRPDGTWKLQATEPPLQGPEFRGVFHVETHTAARGAPGCVILGAGTDHVDDVSDVETPGQGFPGRTFAASGQFDPAHPPSSLHAQLSRPGYANAAGTQMLTVDLDYGGPIPTG